MHYIMFRTSITGSKLNYPCAVRTPIRLAVCESCNRLYTCSTVSAISRQERQIVFNNLFGRRQARLRVEGSRVLTHRPTLTRGYLSLSIPTLQKFIIGKP